MKALSSRRCSGWCDVTKALDSFPHQKLGFINSEEGLDETLWVFRGSKSDDYVLKPSIELETKGKPLSSWVTLESRILDEFKSRARMHLNPSDVPGAGLDEKLSWLSLMRHYGVPTRLLDFTLSPYVAFYFALTNRTDAEKKFPPEIWAIDAQAVKKVAKKRSAEADQQEYEYESRRTGSDVARRRGASLIYFASDGDLLESEAKRNSRMVSAALSAVDARRDHFISHGFVTLATPPIENRRLSCQQGVFLFNGAEDLSFHDSLFRMMRDEIDWYRRFKIVGDQLALTEMERELFRMNIHHLSLFPDIEGLAEFIRQKIRLQWVPDDSPLLNEPEDAAPLGENSRIK